MVIFAPKKLTQSVNIITIKNKCLFHHLFDIHRVNAPEQGEQVAVCLDEQQLLSPDATDETHIYSVNYNGCKNQNPAYDTTKDVKDFACDRIKMKLTESGLTPTA